MEVLDLYRKIRMKCYGVGVLLIRMLIGRLILAVAVDQSRRTECRLRQSRGAICFTTGLAIRQAMGNRYELENDHIFSFSRLKKAGYGKESRAKYSLAQELTNRAILTKTANRAKSDKEADVYLASVKEKFPNALSLQSVPSDQTLWRSENYVEFLRSRRKMLASELNAFLQEIVISGDGAVEVSLEDLVSEGESDELEFKSSLRWDYDNQVVSKKLEDVILKSVASFANGQGGTLLIGVGDDGAPLGLEKDYISLSGDRDRFELHLRNLFNQAFGHSFVTTRVRVSFPTALVARFSQIEGYKCLSLTRVLDVVKCQLALV
jgi:hypothetical protein